MKTMTINVNMESRQRELRLAQLKQWWNSDVEPVLAEINNALQESVELSNGAREVNAGTRQNTKDNVDSYATHGGV